VAEFPDRSARNRQTIGWLGAGRVLAGLGCGFALMAAGMTGLGARVLGGLRLPAEPLEERPAGGGAYTEIATATGSPYQATWNTTSLSSGSYDLRAVVLDAAGNRYAGGAVTVTIDSTAPTVTLADPGSPLSGTVALSASAGPSATRVEFEASRAGAASWSSIGSDTSAPWGVSFDTTRLGDGLYLVAIAIAHAVLIPTQKKMITVSKSIEGGGSAEQGAEFDGLAKKAAPFGAINDVLLFVILYLMVFKPGL